jgi:hypothetical protein
MTNNSPLDKHIVKKYATVSTMSGNQNVSNDPDKIWNTLGAMAMMNRISQQIRKNAA